MKGPLNTCLKDRYTLIEQSDLNTLIEDMHCQIHSNEHVIFSYVMTVNGMRIDSLHGR